MQKLRIWILIALGWFFVLLNIERYHEPINISSFVYVLAMVLCLGIVVVPPMRDRTTGGLVAGSVMILLLLKWALGYQLAGQMLPITITEGLAITVSVLVAHRVSWSIRQFEESVLKLNDIQHTIDGLGFDEMQNQAYREVRRARSFDRPLSVLTIDVPFNADNPVIDQLIIEAQGKRRIEQMRASVIEIVSEELNDSDLLTLRDGKLVLFLTETDGDRAQMVCENVVSQVEAFTGCQVRSGIASFPDEETTLTGLLSRSEADLDSSNRSQSKHYGKTKQKSASQFFVSSVAKPK